VIAVAVSPEPAGEPLAPGDDIDLAVEGVDSLGHALEYTWSADCPDLSSDGEFSEDEGPATTWISPENFTDGVRSCTIEAALADGLGLIRVVSIAQPVAPFAPIPTPTPEPGPTTGHTPDPQVTPSPGPTQAPSGLYVETTGSCGGNMTCFSTLQDALDAASSGATIRIATGMFGQDVSVSRPELGAVTIEAGWNAAFTERGAPALTISRQTVDGRSVVPSLTIEQGSVQIR
jgi:hypothetical protein